MQSNGRLCLKEYMSYSKTYLEVINVLHDDVC